MIRSYLNVLLIVAASFSVYATCQQDTLLPILSGSTILITLFTRLGSNTNQYQWLDKVPLSVIIITSMIAGFLWREIVPVTEEFASPFPTFTAAVQSGGIFACVFFWLRPFTSQNLIRMFFCASLTSAVSINVPFTPERLMVFNSFCFITLAVIILETMKQTKDGKTPLQFYRDFIVYSCLLVSISAVLYYGISNSIVVFDRLFMNMVADHILPRNYSHFLKISPTLNLSHPGKSATDPYPVLQVSLPEKQRGYLKIQTFSEFRDGIMVEDVDTKKHFLLNTILDGTESAKLTMFTSLDTIIPAPPGVVAAKTNGALLMISPSGIVTAEEKQRSRIVNFSLLREMEGIRFNNFEHAYYTRTPPSITDELQAFSSHIVGTATSDTQKALLLKQFFLDNFGYTLNVDFDANNAGLIDMLNNRRPAYCSYFAAALMLLLRSQGIPARVGTGFAVHEMINKKQNIFLARVSDAHAWTEALLPDPADNSDNPKMLWQILDATPASAFAIQRVDRLDMFWRSFQDKFLLTMLQLRARMANIDKQAMRTYVLFVLIAVLIILNSKKILIRLANLGQRAKKARLSHRRSRSDIQQIYFRFEKYLRRTFQLTWKESMTDGEILNQLKCRDDIPRETVSRIESFIQDYHAVRFGNRESTQLKSLIDSFENN